MLEQMNNQKVKEKLQSSLDELKNILNLIEAIGGASKPVPYLNKYTVIKACGTIETSFKIIISDFLISHTENGSLKKFIENNMLNNSQNPSFENIIKSLKSVDINLSNTFKEKFKTLNNSTRVRDSLNSLVKDRNTLAHGGALTTTAQQVSQYFQDSIVILILLEEVCN